MRVGAQIEKDCEVAADSGNSVVEPAALEGESSQVLALFELQGGTGFGDLVAMVKVLDGLFEANRDEQAEDDGGDVDEEVAPGGGGVVRRVDVDHWGWLRFGRGVWLRRGEVWDGLRRLFRDGGAKIEWQID